MGWLACAGARAGEPSRVLLHYGVGSDFTVHGGDANL